MDRDGVSDKLPKLEVIASAKLLLTLTGYFNWDGCWYESTGKQNCSHDKNGTKKNWGTPVPSECIDSECKHYYRYHPRLKVSKDNGKVFQSLDKPPVNVYNSGNSFILTYELPVKKGDRLAFEIFTMIEQGERYPQTDNVLSDTYFSGTLDINFSDFQGVLPVEIPTGYRWDSNRNSLHASTTFDTSKLDPILTEEFRFNGGAGTDWVEIPWETELPRLKLNEDARVRLDMSGTISWKGCSEQNFIAFAPSIFQKTNTQNNWSFGKGHQIPFERDKIHNFFVSHLVRAKKGDRYDFAAKIRIRDEVRINDYPDCVDKYTMSGNLTVEIFPETD